MFYMLHGNAEADYKKREEKLADLFNQLKFYGIEEVSTPLLKELVRLNKNSPLKTVYKHLFKKYQKINHVSSLLVELLEELNGTLNESKNEELKKRQIRIFKQIRKLAGENASPVNESFCLISLLILSLEAGQTQLLYAKEESLADLLNNCQTKVNSLPFGFTKHYLNNILTYLKIKGLIREGENKLALQTLNSMSTSAIEAYNFNLDSSHFYALKDELQKPKYIKRQNYFNLIKTPFIDIHFENRGVSGDRLSYS